MNNKKDYVISLSTEELRLITELIDYELDQLDQEVQDLEICSDPEAEQEVYMIKEMMLNLESIANKIDPDSDDNSLHHLQ